MPELYRQKIIKAFRDNAVRSALLIDDEYQPYEKMADNYVELIAELKDSTKDIDPKSPEPVELLLERLSSVRGVLEGASAKFESSGTARDFVDFFHTKKLVCDVENQTGNLDKDKVRKSDLIILDYHLQKAVANPAERSLNLIEELSHSKHMNMIVVYTAEPLQDVWREVAATLRGTHTGDLNEFLGDMDLVTQWLDNEDDWKDEWNLIYDSNVEANYLVEEHKLDDLVGALQEACQDRGFEEPTEKHVLWLLEQSIQKFNKNNKARSMHTVHGERNLWLQAGDVFVVLCEKKRTKDGGEASNDVTPDEVWEQIKIALESWYPSFYRVVTSELQNQIEDANLSMEKILAKSSVEQIAALWGVLRVHESDREQASRELLENLLNDVVDKVQSSTELLSFVKETADSVDEELPDFVSREENQGRYDSYLKGIVASATKNFARTDEAVDRDFRCQVLHSFNEQLSIEKALPDHISTGVVLKDIESSSYYLCIAPSCNTVPNQTTGMVAKRMTPHRPMRFIKLQNKTDKLARCLKDAHKSDVIFVSDGESRLALSIFEEGSSPTIEQGVVLNHDTQLIKSGEAKVVQFFETNVETKELEIVERKLKPIAKLRAGFASRYQNVQLQHESRIGVDLVSGNMN